ERCLADPLLGALTPGSPLLSLTQTNSGVPARGRLLYVTTPSSMPTPIREWVTPCRAEWNLLRRCGAEVTVRPDDLKVRHLDCSPVGGATRWRPVQPGGLSSRRFGNGRRTGRRSWRRHWLTMRRSRWRRCWSSLWPSLRSFFATIRTLGP